MAVGLAILTAYGSTTIDRLYDQVYATPDAYKQFIPEALRDRPLKDALVVEALEAWAAGEAARIMVGVFLVAAVRDGRSRCRRRSCWTGVGVCSGRREPEQVPTGAPGVDGAA